MLAKAREWTDDAELYLDRSIQRCRKMPPPPPICSAYSGKPAITPTSYCSRSPSKLLAFPRSCQIVCLSVSVAFPATEMVSVVKLRDGALVYSLAQNTICDPGRKFRIEFAKSGLHLNFTTLCLVFRGDAHYYYF